MKNALAALLVVSVVGCQQCARQPVTPTLLHEGEVCQSDDRCDTGLCDAAPGVQAVCVRKCANGCYDGEVCTQLTPGRFSCQKDQRKLCSPCLVDGDCPYPSDRCIVVNGEKVCGRDCAFDQGCPKGYQCVNARGVDGLTKLQQCSPVNASCACLARGDFHQPCEVTNTFGTCKGIKQCDLVQNTVACDAKTPIEETCNGLDDNCNGMVDDGLMPVSCGLGACKRMAASCGPDGGSATCTPGTPTIEACNGIDDDCDGVVDNGFPVESDPNNCGACGHVCTLAHATSDCVSRDCHVATCDMGWGNCDGLHPNGCETDVSADPKNCGACGRACARANSTATCVNSTCQFQCAPGFYDLNGDPSDGCEYACTFMSSTDLPDLGFVDANCDGIDGELTNGIFVAPGGLDTNSGTKASPKATINAALLSLVTTGKRDVYVAAGTYDGPVELNLANNVNVAGGYHPTTWQRSSANVSQVHGGTPALKVEGAVNVLVQTLRFTGANGTASGERTAYGAWVKDSTGVRLESLVITAGNGATGPNGANGATGAKGGNGGSGVAGCVYDTRPHGNIPVECWVSGALNVLTLCDQATGPVVGAAGTSSCGFPGGAGGQASHMVGGNTGSTMVDPGSDGLPAPNGSGLGGTGVPGLTTPSGAPYFGTDGMPGSMGPDGTANAATITATGFVPGKGADGTGGTHGKGGGGGGGGAGGWIPLLQVAGTKCQAYGSGGGGGGGGGCGGGAGLGGQGGGASIGLFVSGSTTTLTAQGVLVNAGNAGNGGNGGTGGAPGVGGTAGPSPVPSDFGSQATAGGKGGAGGQGGRGGSGGGGAGGSVYGIVRSSNATVQGVTVGTMGTPGTGGTAPVAGANGTRALVTTF